ncbi:MAG TPA: DUF3488 and transglutaminase-like domain-containing protein [Rhodocyclaceae bacterium]|nr:DUF3488 and transglutaminase-like domain-containing protein [Rhodocyclaceae bacterium]
MSTAAPLALDRRTVPWLFASAFATTVPHVSELSNFLNAAITLFFVWGCWLWWRGTRLPGRWLLMLCVIAYSVGIVVEYRTLFGRDAGVAMLAGFMALKMLEIRSRRDAHVVVILGYFLLLTHYFYSQTIPTGLWLLTSCILLTATLIRLAGGPGSQPWPTLRYSGLMILQAIPFMLVLYLLFPRVNGPLWGLPQDAFKATSGLSDTMSPGSISDLAQSGEIAFRVRFDDQAPPRDKLYWRGPVMEMYDGQRWQRQFDRSLDYLPEIKIRGPAYAYAITIEPHNQRWVLALDAPGRLPADTRTDPSMAVRSLKVIQQRSRFELSAYPDYQLNLQEAPHVLQRNLQLPRGRNPQTRALASRWQAEDPQPQQIIAKALAYFGKENFVYTLQPPLLGPEGVDDFLFRTRRGFCEHYASAFVVLMRSAGIPARVVGGYQGGEANPVDGYYVIRQSDAHAWAEVWLEGKGWVRVDPTAAVSPERIEANIATALPAGEPLPTLVQINTDWIKALRFRWEAVNNSWNQWVLGYNPDRQRELLSRLGLPNTDWQTLGALLAGVCALLLLAISAWTLYHQPRVDPARRLWLRALRHLRRRQIVAAAWEAPLALAARVEREHPALGAAFRRIAEHYCAARYGTDQSALPALKSAVDALP